LIDSDLTPTPIDGRDGGETVKVLPPRAAHGFRAWSVARQTAGFLFWLARRWTHGRPEHVEMAFAIRRRVEALGGLWVKLGQLIAMRRDLLPNDFCTELGRLQDRAAGFSGDVSRAIIEEELGRAVESVFEDFEEQPFAAASIGQLHRARLRGTGTRVAVKVQRPQIRSMVEQDLALIGLLCEGLNRLRIARNFHWRELCRELAEAIREELDYRLEASSMVRMRRTLRDHGIHAPRVYGRLSRSRILTMEFVNGVLMSDYIGLRERDPAAADRWLAVNDINPARVGRLLHGSLLRQILEDNLFHGDLHPGNIMLLKKSRVALIDFGSVGSLEARFQAIYSRVMRSLSDVDFEKTADLMSLVAPASDGSVDWDTVRRNAASALRNAELRSWAPNLDYSERSMSRALLDVLQSQAALSAPVGWGFMRVDRAHVTLDFSLMYLVPNASYFQLGQAYFKRVNDRSFGPELWAKLRDRLRSDRTFVAFEEVVDTITLARGAIDTSVERSKQHGEIVVEFAAGMLGRLLAVASLLLAAVLGARYLPSTVAGPLASMLPSLTSAAPPVHWTVGLVVVGALLVAAARLIAVERSLTSSSKI
jgi:ubiquinone biosynthesis protein